MAIASAQSILETQIFMALSKGMGATQEGTAAEIISAVGQAASMGLQPVPAPVNFIPVVASGVAAGISLYTASLRSMPADSSASAAALAQAVSVVAPQVPTSGLGTLETQLDVSMRKGNAAEQSVIAAEWSVAIIGYYQAGGIV